MRTKERILFIVAAYAPQKGCTDDEKEEFRDGLQALTDQASQEEILVIPGDMNAHISSDRAGFECIGGFRKDTRNEEGLQLLEKCSLIRWMIANTSFWK